MIYFTIKQPIKYRQFTLEDLLSGKALYPVASNKYQTNTRTFELESPMTKMNGLYDIGELINKLEEFNKIGPTLEEYLLCLEEIPEMLIKNSTIDNPEFSLDYSFI